MRLSALAACTLREGSSWVPLASAAEGTGPARVVLILRSRPPPEDGQSFGAAGVTLWESVLSVLSQLDFGGTGGVNGTGREARPAAEAARGERDAGTDAPLPTQHCPRSVAVRREAGRDCGLAQAVSLRWPTAHHVR